MPSQRGLNATSRAEHQLMLLSLTIRLLQQLILSIWLGMIQLVVQATLTTITLNTRPLL